MEDSLIDIDDGPKAKPSERGWGEPTPLNYEALQAKLDEKYTRLPNNEAIEVVSLSEDRDVPGWAYQAAKYEWKEEYGDVAPEFPELEKHLFTKEGNSQMGEYMNVLKEFAVTQESATQFKPILNFENAGLHPVMVSNIKKCHFTYPTPIQAYCIPAVLHGKDVIAVAQTGSGKTAAYLIPVLSKLMGKTKKLAAPRPDPTNYDPRADAVRAEPLVLIVCPTRELAIQIFDECRRLCYRSQLEDLQKGCDVLIGTPGRLRDIVTNEPRWLSLRRLKYTIIDEADEMLQDSWDTELKEIISGAASQNDGDHVYMMFSATFPKTARQVAKEYMADDHVRIRVGRIGSAHSNILQSIVWVDEEKKKRALHDLLLSLPPCRTLIFVNNVRTVDVLDDYLYNVEFPVASIHAKRTQTEREDAIRSFRKGTSPILVASAITARGLDIKNVMHVINYDLPSVEHGGIDEYVHRIGRTARIGNRGQATSFFNDRDAGMGESLFKIMKESGQEVPDFLVEYAPPEADTITWDDDTDDEGETRADTTKAASGDAWGAEASKTERSPAWGGVGLGAGADVASGGWGTTASSAATAAAW